MNHIQLNFKNEFAGNLRTGNGILKIGQGEGEFLPYELLMGALGSCLYSTFLDIIIKMRIQINTCHMDIEWEKRTEVPTTCKQVIVKVKLTGAEASKEQKLQNAFKLATEYCSVYHTLSQVAEMKYELVLE